MEIDYTLNQLPNHILEEIFAFIPKNKELRHVCKRFKDIIDNSGKLMRNKWLSVERVMNIDSMTINHRYQNLMINENVLLSKEGIDWIHNYPYKDQIKAIEVYCDEYVLFKSAEHIQYIISNYNFLEKFYYFTPYYRTDEIDDIEDEWPNEIRLIPNKYSKLHTLEINRYFYHHNSVLDMFSSIPTIKNFIMDVLGYLRFPSDIKWKLEQLKVKYEDEEFKTEIDEDSCKRFLISQRDTLKKLMLTNSFLDFASLIIRNLPNLEDLSLCIRTDEYIDDDILIRNSRLRRLNIECCELSGSDSTDCVVLEKILNHYNSVEYLSISSFCRDYTLHYEKLINTKFENLTHLLLKGYNNYSFLNFDLPNLKVLVLEDLCDKYDFSAIPSKNLQNINKLTLNLTKIKYVLKVLSKCSTLTELNLDIEDFYEMKNDRFISSINEIISVVPQLNCIGIELDILKHQKLTKEKLMDKISKKWIFIKETKCIKYFDNIQHDDFWLEQDCPSCMHRFEN